MDDEAAGVIRPIEQESVRRIVAGQAVTDLASAVKELVDNSLDAGSKSINSTLFVGVAVCGFSFSLFLCRSSHNRLNSLDSFMHSPSSLRQSDCSIKASTLSKSRTTVAESPRPRGPFWPTRVRRAKFAPLRIFTTRRARPSDFAGKPSFVWPTSRNPWSWPRGRPTNPSPKRWNLGTMGRSWQTRWSRPPAKWERPWPS